MVRTHPVSISKKHLREGGTRVYAVTPFTVIAMPGSPHIRAAVRYRYFLLIRSLKFLKSMKLKGSDIVLCVEKNCHLNLNNIK